jgi:uncharacterized membrane protein YgcG
VNTERLIRFTILATLIAGLLAFPCAATAADLPEQRGHVNDFAGKLPETMKKNLEVSLEKYHEKRNVEIVLVVMDMPDEMKAIPDPGYVKRLSAAWSIGRKGNDRGGCLLIISSDGDEADLTVIRLISNKYEMDDVMEIFRPAIAEPLRDKDVQGLTISALATLMNTFRIPNRLTVH